MFGQAKKIIYSSYHGFTRVGPYKGPMLESAAHLYTEEPPEAPSVHVKDLRASDAPVLPSRTLRFLEGPRGSPNDPGLYFLECRICHLILKVLI